ncbi:hypothetical protein GH741_01615 [Aquibacillus halophilus]|uniref:DUF4030 domain-containing protein n=1 Tax=Aquibacillus halophilus TaxID=930132 RepID=A0A6A8D704_9BACI|nr:hypothetical protein [Aquibacillus halophilus]MRH41368.1 hypothetical protein [Aquibacillus halophilus]
MIKKLILIVLLCVVSTATLSGETKAISEESTVREDLKDLEREQDQIDKLLKAINDMYEEEGSDKPEFSYDERNKRIIIHFSNDEVNDQYQKELTEEISSLAKDIGLEHLDIKWQKEKKDLPEPSKKEKERIEISSKIMNQITDSLREEGYDVDSLSLKQHVVYIRMDESVENFKKNKDKIKAVAEDSIASITKEIFEVNVTRKSAEEKLEQQWSPIFHVVSNLAERKFAEYRGFAYSFHPAPLQIIIKTNIEKPSWFEKWVSKTDERVVEIENYVEEIIAVKKEQLQVTDIPYEIIIRGKDEQKLN